MELKIDSYILTLLFNHNCVIIPTFGGFVGNYKGAEIHPTQYIFNAPRKQLAFNKNLTINDGLLANHIAQTEKLSYSEALEIIDKEVFKLKHLLQSGEKICLQNIGFLKLDVEKNIQFSPSSTTNFETSSFGLHSFQSSAIKRGNYANDLGKTFIDRPSIKANKGFKKYKKFIIPALILPIALLLYISPVAGIFKEKVQIQTSGYFSSNPTALYKPIKHEFNLVASELKPLQTLASAEPTVLVEPKNEIAVAETSHVETPIVQPIETPLQGSYTLISGCFAVLQNAEKQIEHLKSKNINASIIGKTKTGLFRVGCGSFNSATEANEAMMNLKAQQTDVWVLKN
ncbi:MAG TPA: SPOR domain-containing protein [Bacteroidia bacterium]|nr:SPOR domain-containing protein [Bacteroidia bacterium]